jgi:hypothetical protein
VREDDSMKRASIHAQRKSAVSDPVMARLLILVLIFITIVGDGPRAYAGETQSRLRTQPEAGTQRKDNVVRYVLVGSVLVLGAVAAICDVESDREYSRYLETANPTRMHSYYDGAERYRDVSNAALIGAEACAVGLVVHLLKAKPGKEPRPDGIRISLGVGPQRAEVSFRW